MVCKICNSETSNVFNARVRNIYNVKYYYCANCGFLQTEDPYWLDEAYQEPINRSDTGILARNSYLSKQVAALLFFFFDKKGKFLDFAGGYGIFTRLMRDIGFDFYWSDPYVTNLFAKGFEYASDIKKIELITSFESFEHFVNPFEEIEKMLQISKNILFSTELLKQPIPKINDWWYYGLEHGQHISFYSLKTLEFISNKYKLNLYSSPQRGLHLLSYKKLNPYLFSLISNLNKIGIYSFIKKQMKSRTMNDMIQQIK